MMGINKYVNCTDRSNECALACLFSLPLLGHRTQTHSCYSGHSNNSKATNAESGKLICMKTIISICPIFIMHHCWSGNQIILPVSCYTFLNHEPCPSKFLNLFVMMVCKTKICSIVKYTILLCQ